MKINAKDVSFRRTVLGHGWSALAPFRLDGDAAALSFALNSTRGPVAVTVRPDAAAGLEVESDVVDQKNGVREEVLKSVCRIFRLDDDLGEFYAIAQAVPGFEWIPETGSGRLLRSPTVFEDLVKTICTTNCSWSLTKAMITNLVETLGEEAPSGRKAFPTAGAMAEMPPEFFREEIKAGYRSDYLSLLAISVAEGSIHPEDWLDPDLPSPELRKNLLGIKGVGVYAAENMMKLLGKYDGLALDSYLRSEFYKRHNRGNKCPDARIERYYSRFGKWKGLAIWFDMCGAGEE